MIKHHYTLASKIILSSGTYLIISDTDLYTVHMSKNIVVVAHNIRSTHNIGSLMRTCDGFGVDTIYFTGYTPYPRKDLDSRLPHIVSKLHKQIQKTALGAEDSLRWRYVEDPMNVINHLKKEGYVVIALEQAPASIALSDFVVPSKIALIIGEEVRGVNQNLLKLCTLAIEIPMFGKKESFNVSVAAAIALYHFRFN